MVIHPMREVFLKEIRITVDGVCVLHARMRTGLAENPFFAFRVPALGQVVARDRPTQARIEWQDSRDVTGTFHAKLAPAIDR